MKIPVKLRVIAFASAIVLVALGSGLMAQKSLRQVSQLSEKLTSEQIESFQAADKFRANLQDLNSILLFDYQIHQHDPNDWAKFLRGRKQLDEWIDTQTNSASAAESRILNEINSAYDNYFMAATNLEVRPGQKLSSAQTTDAFKEVKKETDQLLHLDNKLLAAHRASLTEFLADSRQSLNLLRNLVFAALSALLVLGALLAVMVYRDLIAPLQRKLVESHAIIERQEKLAALGVLAAGVAHEIRNPLTAIKARLFTQQKALKPDSPERADAVVIGKEIQRLEAIVKDVLQFARPDEPRFAVLPATAPLREVRDLMAPQLTKAGHQLVLDSVADAQVRVDTQQLKQVLINLIQNAADSIEGAGVITLRARTHSERLNGQTVPAVILEVQDTGKGISPEVRERLFDPFFSTKENGTGLGLAIAARIVEKHGGALSFQTQLNHGTTFAIVLPEAR